MYAIRDVVGRLDSVGIAGNKPAELLSAECGDTVLLVQVSRIRLERALHTILIPYRSGSADCVLRGESLPMQTRGIDSVRGGCVRTMVCSVKPAVVLSACAKNRTLIIVGFLCWKHTIKPLIGVSYAPPAHVREK